MGYNDTIRALLAVSPPRLTASNHASQPHRATHSGETAFYMAMVLSEVFGRQVAIV